MTLVNVRNKYFGDRTFYRMVLAVAVPMMIQNFITNFVGLLDNIMVGQLGTEATSAVAIMNQLMFVFYLCIFGGLSGAGIFTAQYYGSRNEEGIRMTMRFKLWTGFALVVGTLLVFGFGSRQLIGAYLQGSTDAAATATVMALGQQYLRIMMISLPAFALSQCYASTLKECGETFSPMLASAVAVGVNLVFNYLLIYGKFGFPRLGVVGAALATVLSRYVELVILLCWVRSHHEKASYFDGLYRTMAIPLADVKLIFLKGMPLLFNEALWSIAMAILSQCYSVRGLDVVAGFNIANTISNMLNVAFFALGTSVSIIVGQLLGAGDLQRAKETDTRMIVFAVIVGIATAALGLIIAPLFPQLYKVSDLSREYATRFISVACLFYPVISFLHSIYFTLRTGGRTMITFFFDCGFAWIVSIPVAFVLSRYTLLGAVMMYIIVEACGFIKCILGYILVKKNIWLNRIVD